MTKGYGRLRSPLKPKYGLNGAPKASVGVVISLLTRARESTARDDKGEGGDFYWEPLDRDGQKETAGQFV